MALTCKICGRRTAERSDLYCQDHALKTLRKQLAVGYLSPLCFRTYSGIQVASSAKFLTLEEYKVDREEQDREVSGPAMPTMTPSQPSSDDSSARQPTVGIKSRDLAA